MSSTLPTTPADVAIRWFLSSQLSQEAPRAVFPISRRCTIGRQPGLDLTLSSSFVSSKHAELSCLSGRLVLHDLGSRNGTFVNGDRVRRPAYLAAGDLIRMGDIKFRVHAQTNIISETPHPLTQLNQTWIRSQMFELLKEKQFVSELDPIYSSIDATIAAYSGTMRSSVTGLETAEKMAAAANWIGCEAELSREVRQSVMESAWDLTRGKPLLVPVHSAENLALEVLPQLHRTVIEFPQLPLVVLLSDIETRDASSLEVFLQGLRAIGMEWGVDWCRMEQLALLPVGKSAPTFVRLHPALTDSLLTSSEPSRSSMTNEVQVLHKRGIRVIAKRVTTAEHASVCCKIGIDLLQGPAFSAPSTAASGLLSGTMDFHLESEDTFDSTLATTSLAMSTSPERSIPHKGLAITSHTTSQGKTNPLSIDLIRKATDWDSF